MGVSLNPKLSPVRVFFALSLFALVWLFWIWMMPFSEKTPATWSELPLAAIPLLCVIGFYFYLRRADQHLKSQDEVRKLSVVWMFAVFFLLGASLSLEWAAILMHRRFQSVIPLNIVAIPMLFLFFRPDYLTSGSKPKKEGNGTK